jgi:hypothetical protein
MSKSCLPQSINVFAIDILFARRVYMRARVTLGVGFPYQTDRKAL